MVKKLTYLQIKNSLHYRSLKFLSRYIGIRIPGTPTHPGRVLGDGNWGTHMVPLVTAVINSEGPVLELGAGDYSTPLLHALCRKDKRFLHTTDADEKWLELFTDLKTSNHKLTYVSALEDNNVSNPAMKSWDEIGNDNFWSVVFVDHSPAKRRHIDIKRLRNNTNIFVVHDSEQPSYEYETVLPTFKYRYDYTRYKSRTTLVSDITDVASFFD